MYISTAPNRQSKNWRNIEMTWDAFAQRCREPARTNESHAEYLAMSRDEQTRIKDVGGFVGGSLIGNQRRNGCINTRSLITLDIDFGEGFDFDAFAADTDLTCLAYSTHKHSAETPRYRLIVLPNRDILPQEYEPVARMLANKYVGMQYLDHTTFDATRMMFWGSCSKDAEYFFKQHDGVPADVDALLREYTNWRNEAEWPRCIEEQRQRQGDTPHADGFPEDPLTKNGIVGDFCRAYTISEAIDTFLSGCYRPTAAADRYTYIGGTTAGGLVVYDDKFAYSHHNTDPCSGLCCNAFDLVMRHQFDFYDDQFERMCAFAEADEKVKRVRLNVRLTYLPARAHRT